MSITVIIEANVKDFGKLLCLMNLKTKDKKRVLTSRL